MPSLRDTSPIVAEVLDGVHDNILEHLSRAADWRLKQRARETGFRPGTRIRVKPDADNLLGGREGRVVKVNPKTIGIQLDPEHDNDYRLDWRVPHSYLEAA